MSEQKTIAATPRPVPPDKIDRSQVIEACRILGLDPHAVSNLQIDVNQVVVTWWPIPGEDTGGLSVVYDARWNEGKPARTLTDTFERIR